MVKRIKSDSYSIVKVFNAYEATKRALVRRGLVPGRILAKNPGKQVTVARKKVDKPKAKEIRKFARNADEIIYDATSVFPFQLFPDTITIDREKVTIAHRVFFRVANIISINVNDTLSVEADVGPFFGRVLLSSRYFSKDPQAITWLSRSAAIKTQRIIQGYVVAHQEKIDCSRIEKKELANLLEKMGTGATD